MFYDNLKAECEKQGLKITPIVLECGGTKGVIGGWKKGAFPNSDIVMKLSVRLNVPTDYLLFGKTNSKLSSISNSAVGAVGNNSNGTVTINHSNTPKPQEAESEKQELSETSKELLEIFESLPIRERIKLLNIIYDYEEQYRQSQAQSAL